MENPKFYWNLTEEGVKKRRQFVLEEVANWHAVSAFREEGKEVLRNAHRRARISKMNRDAKGSWNHVVTQIEREGREEEEFLKVVDEESAKRAIEILYMGIAIQDLASSKEVKGLDVLYLTKEVKDKTLERVVMRMRNNKGAAVAGGEFTWDLTTPKSKTKRKEKLEGTPAQQLAKLKSKMEEIEEEEGSDNEVIAKKTAKKEKRVVRKDRTSLSQLEEEMEVGFIELAVPRLFEEVKTNISKTAPPSWKLKDS